MAARKQRPPPRAAEDLFAHFGVELRRPTELLTGVVESQPCPQCSWLIEQQAEACPLCGWTRRA